MRLVLFACLRAVSIERRPWDDMTWAQFKTELDAESELHELAVASRYGQLDGLPGLRSRPLPHSRCFSAWRERSQASTPEAWDGDSVRRPTRISLPALHVDETTTIGFAEVLRAPALHIFVRWKPPTHRAPFLPFYTGSNSCSELSTPKLSAYVELSASGFPRGLGRMIKVERQTRALKSRVHPRERERERARQRAVLRETSGGHSADLWACLGRLQNADV